MEMPFYLKTLPPEALEIIRYFRQQNARVAYSSAIVEGTDLSERAFGKAIRRLVTRGYLVLDGDGRYRLTEQGHRAVDDLPDDAHWELEDSPDEPVSARYMTRRLVVTLPQPFVAETPADITIGFLRATGGEPPASPESLLLRVGVLNGQPSPPVDVPLLLGHGAGRCAVRITPGRFQQARLRVAVFRLDDRSQDLTPCGGLYVDADVVPPDAEVVLTRAAYGADVRLSSPA